MDSKIIQWVMGSIIAVIIIIFLVHQLFGEYIVKYKWGGYFLSLPKATQTFLETGIEGLYQWECKLIETRHHKRMKEMEEYYQDEINKRKQIIKDQTKELKKLSEELEELKKQKKDKKS